MYFQQSEVNLNGHFRKPSGQFIFTGPDGTVEQFTLKCVHCGYNWHVEPGSGKKRGWCMKCKGPICGAEWCCKECVPNDAQLDIMGGDRSTIQRYWNTHFVQEFLGNTNNKKLEEYTFKNGILVK